MNIENKLFMLNETSMKQLKASSSVQCLHFYCENINLVNSEEGLPNKDSLTEDLEVHLTLTLSLYHTNYTLSKLTMLQLNIKNYT